ncbi:imelysin family protein [Actinoplanes sp. NPDC051513]|uniref:imelysin family protein n=1 Tax=Actinoplanes sp. NPDC051513 TaxID=3363908 RepID=UPI0037AAD13E
MARTYWERIEPVATIFGDLDPKIDGREDAVEPGAQFTGFHRLEKDLWAIGDITKSGSIADQLTTDVDAIATKATAAKLSPLNLADGAKSLLDEVATGKITGEEDRYSHTDLWDFAANIEGSKAAIAALRPVLQERAPELVK